ncbi:MAG: hypothetical protein NW205_12140 [Hyphomicrobiaceae bacterium]|nr:hypothetical protein [Hyphomicrobiaceae bacterium]
MLLFLTVAGGLVFCRYAQEIAAARVAVSEIVRTARTAAAPLEYAKTVSGTPPRSIRCAEGCHSTGLGSAPVLAVCGFRIFAPTRIGNLGPVAYEWQLSAKR